MALANRTTLGGKRGIDVLRDPEINKPTAFTEAEREALSLTGFLPSGIDMEAMVVSVGRSTTRSESSSAKGA